MLRPDDELTALALPSLHGEKFDTFADYEVIRSLPDPTIASRFGPYGRRARTTLGRSTSRWQLVAERRHDLLHVHNLVWQTDWAEVAALARRIPLLSTVHDVRPHRESRRPRLEQPLLRRLYRSAGHLLVHHDILAEELVSDFGVQRDFVHVLPMPINGRNLRTGPPPAGPPVVALFGALRPNKGVDVLLDAACLLENESDVRFVIAGAARADDARSWQERASRLSNVELTIGFASPEQKHQILSRASMAVLPYTSFHSQSAALADAYAYRIPVVASNVGALGPTVTDEATGIVVPPRDAEQLGAAISQVLSADQAVWVQAIESAVAQRSETTQGPHWRELYDTISRE